jgi:large subunit ribosomal protein L15
MPLYRKLPHRGFNQAAFRAESSIVNVGALATLEAGITEVNASILAKAGLVRDEQVPVKVLGGGEIARALKVTAAKFSASAKEKIEKAGGQAVVE